MNEGRRGSCHIVSSVPLGEEREELLAGAEYRIAADAGYLQLEALGLSADVVVGDFDSAPQPSGGAEVIVLPSEKDDTDTVYAAKLALARGWRDITLFGAWGRRPDHSTANLQLLLYLAQNGAAAKLACSWGKIWCLGPGKHDFPQKEGACLSVLAAGGAARGICLAGVKYPLENATLTPDYPLGISNEFAGDARVTVGSGYIYVFVMDKTEDEVY